MVVVTDSRLVAGQRTRRLQSPQQPDLGQGLEDVVDGLVRHGPDLGPDGGGDRLGVGVRRGVHRSEHREPRARHPERGRAQQALGVGGLHEESDAFS